MQTEQKKISLKCLFTKDEQEKMGKELAETMLAKASLKEELKETTSEIKAKIAQCDRIIREDATNIKNGYEYRLVECEVTYNAPTRGQKSVLRSDTGETIVMEMTKDEKADLYYNADEPEEEQQ